MAFEGLSERLENSFKKLRAKGKLTESDVKEAMREVRMALLEADVNYKVAKDFTNQVVEAAVGAKVMESLTPAQMVIKIVNEQLTQLMGVQVSVAVNTDEEGNVRVNMMGDEQGVLIGRRGETLDALQYLTSLQVNKGRGEYTRVTLDTEGYRARREEALIRLANRMANRAVKTGRRVSLEPMNPYERRILHSALQGNDAVTTHSEGEEPNRHVVITINKPQRPKKAAASKAQPAEEAKAEIPVVEETATEAVAVEAPVQESQPEA